MRTASKEQKIKAIETPELDPLYYGPRFGNVLFPPSSFAMGNAFLTPENTLDENLAKWQTFTGEQIESGKLSKETLPPKYLELVDANLSTVKTAMIAGIIRVKGTNKLYTMRPEEVILEGYLGHTRLTARVASRRDPQKEEFTFEYWQIVVDSPHYNDRTAVSYKTARCQGDEVFWGRAKGVDYLCTHSASAIIQAYRDFSMPEEKRRIKFVNTEGMSFVPFTMPPETEADILVRYFHVDEGLYQIDKRLLANQENYHPLFLPSVEAGNIVFEAVPLRHRPKKVKEDDIEEGQIKASRFLMSMLAKQFIKEGYKRRGVAAVELKDTELESIAETWERDGQVLRPFYNEKFGVPLVFGRTLSEEINVFGNTYQQSPLHEEYEDVDDRTRRRSKTILMIPADMRPYSNPIDIPYILKRKYQEFIEKLYPDRSSLTRPLRLY